MYTIKKSAILKQTTIPHHDSMKEKFLMINKELFYTGLSVDEILVYAYLRDKRDLSLSTWEKGDLRYLDFDEQDIFCVVSNQELMNFMKIKGKQKIVGIKKRLEELGLIKQERQFDNSNKIYVYDYQIENIEK